MNIFVKGPHFEATGQVTQNAIHERLYLQELEEDSNSEKKPADEGNKQNLFNNPHEVYIGLQIFN